MSSNLGVRLGSGPIQLLVKAFKMMGIFFIVNMTHFWEGLWESLVV